jgi:hypothetical protein
MLREQVRGWGKNKNQEKDLKKSKPKEVLLWNSLKVQ